MYLIVIAWLYVTVMMAVAEATVPNGSLLGAVITFVLYGLLPCAILIYIFGTPQRKRRLHAQRQKEQQEWEADKQKIPQTVRTMAAAMRPVLPKIPLSRRCEKKREGLATVHHPVLESLP